MKRLLIATFILGDLLACTAAPSQAPECTSSQSQNGTTVCGLNNEGVFVQTCTTGDWADTAQCTGKDSCHNGDAENQECGLNDSGMQTRRCSNGAWEDWSQCNDPDSCQNDSVESQSCGYNENGSQTRECNQGQWSSWQDCNDPDECVNAQSQNGTTPCGLNNNGTLQQNCVDGKWADDSSQCNDPDQCVNNTQENEWCGFNNNGTQTRSCYEGTWTHFNDCVDPDVCTNEATETKACGINSAGISTSLCDEGQWGPYECIDPDVCLNGESQNGTTECGDDFLGVYRQNCTSGQWVDDLNDCSGVCVDLEEENYTDTVLQFYDWAEPNVAIRECPANSVAVGVRGRAGNWIDQLTLLCRTLHPTGYVTGDIIPTSSVGTSGGGTEGESQCPNDRAMVGAQGGTKLNYISCIRPSCAEIDHIHSSNPASEFTSADLFGSATDCSNDDSENERRCPDGYVVTGVVGWQHHNHAGSLQWRCRPLKNCGL